MTLSSEVGGPGNSQGEESDYINASSVSNSLMISTADGMGGGSGSTSGAARKKERRMISLTGNPNQNRYE